MIFSAVRLSVLCAFPLVLLGCAMTQTMTCSGVYGLEDGGWYKIQMKAAHAKPLCLTGSPEKEKYRFVWLRSFHDPIVVNLVKNGDKIKLMAVRLGRTGNIAERSFNTVTQGEFGQFKGLIDDMDFWSPMSYRQLVQGTGDISLDGAQWILEGAIHDKAHAVDRWGGGDASFRKAALFLLEKSGIDPNGEIY
jgi:hypothetical protein